MKVSERELRKWLTSCAGGHIGAVTWIEPNRGSTAGVPDAQLMLVNVSFRVPVELKVWEIAKKLNAEQKERHGNGVVFVHAHMRPAQRRYHLLSAQKGHPTFVLVGVGDRESFAVYALKGNEIPLEDELFELDQNKHMLFCWQSVKFSAPPFGLLSSALLQRMSKEKTQLELRPREARDKLKTVTVYKTPARKVAAKKAPAKKGKRK